MPLCFNPFVHPNFVLWSMSRNSLNFRSRAITYKTSLQMAGQKHDFPVYIDRKQQIVRPDYGTLTSFALGSVYVFQPACLFYLNVRKNRLNIIMTMHVPFANNYYLKNLCILWYLTLARAIMHFKFGIFGNTNTANIRSSVMQSEMKIWKSKIKIKKKWIN
jgi:hypothetical protein